MRHGGDYAYGQGCRCRECVHAHNAKHRAQRHRRSELRPENNPTLEHGTRSTYSNHGCRCAACVAAQAESNRLRPSRARPR